MTRAKVNWRKLTLDLDGHANSAEYGKDIVCAAESMLTQALVQTLIDMQEEKLLGMDWTGSPEMGFLHVEAAPAKEHEAEARACFRLTVTGLRMLAESYPDYITIKEEE